MKTKTSDLAGTPLDWAVATCEGWGRLRPNPHRFNPDLIMSDDRGDAQYLKYLDYSTDWAQGGPIIERVGLNLRRCYTDGKQNKGEDAWKCDKDFHNGVMTLGAFTQYGPTALIAAMRCYVASKLGDEVEVPDELV